MNFRIFDCHLHTYGTFLGPNKDLITYLDENNIEKAVLTTINRAAKSKIFNTNPEEREKDGQEKTNINQAFENLRKLLPKYQLDHQDVISLSNLDPKRFVKFFWFNPKFDMDKEEKNYRILEDHFKKGFCGVKIHSGINLIKIPRDINKLVSFMQDFDKRFPLFIHSTPKTSYFGGVSCKDIVNLASNNPELTIIVGHAALAMEYAIDLGLALKKFKNVFFETSCSIPYGILSLIKTIGPERIIFGSDAPVTNPLSLEIDKITCLPVSNDIKQDIFYNNAEKLFNRFNC
ncbi:MAG: amidohydrolase family protein [Candidatus Lokiarchaeota archaeon]|nr:amidohydrolase family protein [Candidatus Lokiarchaeota archaeon]